jgi:GTPase SAR1 family protein
MVYKKLTNKLKKVKLYNIIDKIPRIIVGTKFDLQREIAEKKAMELAKKYGCEYYEISSKTGENVDECIKDIFD